MNENAKPSAVDEAWAALREDLARTGNMEAVARNRPLIEAAVRAECASEPLEVERLGLAIFAVTVAEPGLLSDVDMLNDPTEGDPHPAAEAIAREYAALREKQP